MSDITIKLLEKDDAKELFDFEIKNRSFFEKTCLPRGNSYYKFNNFIKIINELVDEQNIGMHYMYIIRNSENKIVGRVNLVDIVRGNFNKAEIGYRIGHEYIGRGYGEKAVKLALDDAVNKYKLHRIEAGVSPENIASQKVLIKNDFNVVGTYKKYILLNGKWYDSIIFEKVLD